jgi:chondroitin AC lyase
MNATDDFSTLRARLTESLTDSSVPAEKTTCTLQSLRDDGTWPDIDLLNRNGDAWEPMAHLDRMRELAIVFRSSGGDAEIADAVKRALKAWVNQDPTNDNWWYNH